MEGGRAGEQPTGGSGDGVDALIGAFTRWAGDERLRQRAAERSRQRWLRQQALESATLGGILVDLAEQDAAVTAQTTGHALAGRLVGVGDDLAVLEDDHGRATVVNLASLVSVDVPAPQSGRAPLSGRRPPVLRLAFLDALAALASELVPVQLYLAGGRVAGELLAAGEDVVVLRVPAAIRRHRYVNVARIEACSLR